MRGPGPGLSGPLVRSLRGRQCVRSAQHRRGAIELTEFHRDIVDDLDIAGRTIKVSLVIGAGKDLLMAQPGDGPPFGVVGVEQSGGSLSAEYGRQLPGQVVRVFDSGVGAVTATIGWQLVRGVSYQENPTGAEVVGDECGEFPTAGGEELDRQVGET